MRRFRYQIGRWISGSRPFLPYLEQECWESEWHTSTSPTTSSRSRASGTL
jgi:hypothetical protein